MPKHTCHAKGCSVAVPPSMFMCRHHWRMVPKRLKDAIWEEYIPGQEIRKDPTLSYLRVAQEAIQAVAKKEAA